MKQNLAAKPVTWLLSLVLLIALVWSAPVPASEFRAGEHYRVIDQPRTVRDGEGVEIADVFWYGCPHCYTFKPMLDDWIATNSERVRLVRLPALVNRGWQTHAQAWYTAQALGKADELHGPVFDAIHQGGQRLNQRRELRDFFEQQGVDPEAFDSAWESFAVDAQLRRARQLNSEYGIRGTPSVVVNGRYMTSPSMVGTYQDFFRLLDELVTREAGGEAEA